MSDITHMGLPQGLPEIPGGVMSGQQRYSYDPALNSRYQGDNQWAQSWNPPPKRTPPPAREMTAADLGLPLMQWSYTWLEQAYGLDWRALSEAAAPDAPYSFWLGADHG
jgi:hypothetical protein